MKNLLRYCLMLLLLFQTPADAQQAGEIDLYRHKVFVRQVFQQTKERLRPVLSATELQVLSGIDISVTDSWGVNAFATRTGGRDLVVVPGGMVAIIEWMADAMVVQQISGHNGFLEAYMRYLEDAMSENTDLIKQHQRPNPVWEPYSWSARPESGFAPVSVNRVRNDPQLSRKRNDMIFYSLQLLLLHELGHHMSGHLARPMNPQLINAGDAHELSKSRRREREADLWALRRAKDLKVPLLATSALYLFFAMSSQLDADEETASTHPSGLRRLSNFVDVALDEPNAKQLYANEPWWPEFRDSLAMLRQQFPAN